MAAAWLHNIGYAPDLVETGFHPLDGARYLRSVGVDGQAVSLVAYHSCAQIEADVRGLGAELASEFSPADSLLADVLLYCDMTTGPGGAYVRPADRLVEVARRVTRSSVYWTLVHNGLVEPKSRRRRRKDYRRWERGTPMELWQLDVTASAFLADRTEVKIVTGIDDHSRFCVLAKAVIRATARPVCRAFGEAMRAYEIPEEVLTDNAKVFTGRFHKPGVPVEVLFDKICRENGITHRFTKIHSPRPRPGRPSGCIRPCSASCWMSMGRSRASRRCRPRWMPGARSTTLTARTSPWAWLSPLAGSRQHPRRWSCASRPSQLRGDLEWFAFLLGGSDGEPLFGP